MSATPLPVSPAADANTGSTPRPAVEILPPLNLQRVQNDTFLIVNSYNSLASLQLGVRARVLADDGSIYYVDGQTTPNTDRSVKSDYFRLVAGLLLDASVFPVTGTPRRGQTFVVLSLGDRLQPIPQRQTLIAKGYVNAGHGLVYPHGAWCDSVEGPGWMRSAAQGSPAVATDFTITVPTGARWNLRALVAQLVTDTTAQTRVVSLVIDDGTTTLFSMPYPTGQIQSLTRQYYWDNFAYAIGLVGTGIYLPAPLPFPLLAGWRISSSTTLKGAADQWSAIQYDVEEWIEP